MAAISLLAIGCGGVDSTNSTINSDKVTGASFVVGTDAPAANVVSFAVQVQSVNAIDASGNSVPLLSGTPTVDFARYNGLQTLLDMIPQNIVGAAARGDLLPLIVAVCLFAAAATVIDGDGKRTVVGFSAA